MKTKLTALLALAVAALALGLVLMAPASSAAPVPLTNLNGTHTGPRASSTVAPNDRPTIFKINETRSVNPSRLAPGGSATFSTKIRVNPYAANWTTAGNLITVGLLREIANETRDGNTPFLPAHDGDPSIWFQNNNPEGVGMCLDKQFFVNNMFVFGQSGVQQCGLPQDNATQTAAAPGSFVKYSVTVFPDNTYRLVVEHLDANGNRVTNLNQLSPAANPYVITGALPHAADSNYFPYLRLRVGRDTGGNGIANPESNWEFQISESALDVEAPLVVRPDSLQGWQPSTSSASQSIDFIAGPAVPPLSTGSVQLSVGPDGNGAAQLRHPGYNNTKLSNLTALAYSTYVSAPGSGGQAPYIILGVDHDNNAATAADLLFFEPVYQTAAFFPANPQAPVVTSTWQTWDALNGGWWSVNGFAGATPGTGVKSLATYFAAFPDAKIVNTASGLGGVRLVAGFGAGAWDNFVGSVDAFRIGVSNDDTVYDFEPLPCATPTNVALSASGATAVASSTHSANFPASSAINGDRKGTGWGAGTGGWNDGTRAAFPDTLEINLGGAQPLGEIAVYTLQDNFSSPVEPTEATTFTAYGITAFDVQYWDGDSWENVPNGTVSGNNRVKRRFVFGTPITTDRIRVVVNAAADGHFSRIVEVEALSCDPQTIPTPTPTPTPTPECNRINVAAAQNGGTAVASSTINANFPASATINGDRKGLNWGSGGGWNDGTRGVYPDTLEVTFSAPQTISEIAVYTLQDAFSSPVEPTDATTFSAYGITSFDVQTWNGASWVTVPGGSITGNNKVKRAVAFAPITTDKIRVVVNASADNLYSRIVEVEAFACSVNGVLCVAPGGASGCHATLQSAVNAANPGDRINVKAGTYVLSSTTNVNKANLLIQGEHTSNTIFQIPGSAGHGLSITGAGTTLRTFQIQKTDLVSPHNLILVSANNVTFSGNLIYGPNPGGTWAATGLVSRAFEVAGGLTGLVLDGNTIRTLRQPGYINPGTVGTISNNLVGETRGWVVDGAQITFTNNAWGPTPNQGADIALLASVNPAHYPDLVALSAANNNAFISGQFAGASSGRAVAYVNDDAAPGGDGSQPLPYQTVASGVGGALTNGAVQVAAGTYNETVTVNRAMTLRGAQVGVDARTRPGTPALESVMNASGGAFSVTASNVTIDGFTVQNASAAPLATGVALAGSTSGSRIQNNRIRDNTFGLYLNSNGATQTVVRRNHFDINNRAGASSGDAIYSDQGASNLLVEENRFTGHTSAAMVFAGTQSNVTVNNNDLVADNSIVFFNSSAVSVTNNWSDNSLGSVIFLGGGNSNVTITANRIRNGAASTSAIRIPDFGAGTNTGVVAGNNAFENMPYGIRITTGMHVGTLNAENNWWGSATGPTVASNPSGTGVLLEDPDGVVDYTPFLTSSPF